MPQLSVVVPVYKVEKYLDQCIQSVLSQTFADLELILVDDGSPDGSPAMCDAWAEKDARVRVIHQPNSGVVAARQNGVLQAKGKYVSFVDADDFIHPQMMETMLCRMEKEDADYAVCGCVLYWEDRQLPEPGAELTADRQMILESIIPEFIDDRSLKCAIRGYACASVCRRELAQQSLAHVPQELKTREDRLQTLHILANCSRITLLKDCFYYYRQREDSAANAQDAFVEENAQRFWRAFSQAAAEYGYSCGETKDRVEQEKLGQFARVLFSQKNYFRKCEEMRYLRKSVKKYNSLLMLGEKNSLERVLGICVYTNLYPVLVAAHRVYQKTRGFLCAK